MTDPEHDALLNAVQISVNDVFKIDTETNKFIPTEEAKEIDNLNPSNMINGQSVQDYNTPLQ